MHGHRWNDRPPCQRFDPGSLITRSWPSNSTPSFFAQPRRGGLDLPIALGMFDPVLFVPVLPIRISSRNPLGRVPGLESLFAIHGVDGFERETLGFKAEEPDQEGRRQVGTKATTWGSDAQVSVSALVNQANVFNTVDAYRTKPKAKPIPLSAKGVRNAIMTVRDRITTLVSKLFMLSRVVQSRTHSYPAS